MSSFSFCQQTEKLNVDSLKLELAKFLVEKNQLKNLEEFTVKNRGVYLGGIHKKKLDEELKNGLYVFNNNSNHSFSFFIIINDNSFTILDISTFQGLKESIKQFLIFADKEKYCHQIINDYTSRLLSVHYNINRNPINRANLNCEYESKPTKSTYDLNLLKTKLAEFLIEKEEIKDIDYIFKYPEFLIVNKTGIYYGIKDDEKMDSGVYSFGFANLDSTIKFYIVILNKDWTEIFDIDSFENLLDGINKILDFAENHNYCHLRTVQILEQIIKMKRIESCLDNPNFELP